MIAQQPGERPRHTHCDAPVAEGVVFRVRRRAANHFLFVQATDVGDRLAVQHALDAIAIGVIGEAGCRRAADADEPTLGIVGQGVRAAAHCAPPHVAILVIAVTAAARGHRRMRLAQRTLWATARLHTVAVRAHPSFGGQVAVGSEAIGLSWVDAIRTTARHSVDQPVQPVIREVLLLWAASLPVFNPIHVADRIVHIGQVLQAAEVPRYPSRQLLQAPLPGDGRPGVVAEPHLHHGRVSQHPLRHPPCHIIRRALHIVKPRGVNAPQQPLVIVNRIHRLPARVDQRRHPIGRVIPSLRDERPAACPVDDLHLLDHPQIVDPGYAAQEVARTRVPARLPRSA